MYVPKDYVGVKCFYVHYFDLDFFAPDFFGWLYFVFFIHLLYLVVRWFLSCLPYRNRVAFVCGNR